MSKTFNTPFIKKIQESDDSYSFYFDRKNVSFNFLPGQYIKISLNIENPDDRGSTRFFSVASSPTEHDYLFITTRIIKSSFKLALSSLKKGEVVRFMGPYGKFVLREDENRPKVFVAGGIGVTPFRSMIKYSQNNNFQNVLYLFNSFKDSKDITYYSEMNRIKESYLVFNYIPTVTENKSLNWVGKTGRIDAEMIKTYIKDISSPIYYVAGPEVMIDALSKVISDMGVRSEDIRSEGFPGY